MKRGKRTPLLIALGAVVLVAAFVIASLGRNNQHAAVEVRMEKVKRDRLESWVRAPGQVRPERLVQISSNVMGRVQGLAVQEGARVRRGDLLLTLDDERYRSMLSGMQAQLEAARADLNLAEAQREKSRQTLVRQEALATAHLLSDEALEQARTQAKTDEARYAAAAEAQRARRASLAEAEKDLKETVFRAPMDGIVTALNVEEGENVMTGTMNNPGTVILTLADLDTMEVEAEVDETDVPRVLPGMTAKVKVDAWEDSVLTGSVTSVGMSGRKGSSTGQQGGTSFLVKVRIADPPRGIRPGMTGDVEIQSGVRDSATVVPIQALVAQPERVVQRWTTERKQTPRERAQAKAKSAGTGEAALPDSAKANDKMIEGIFLVKEGKTAFVPVRLGLRGDTYVEISGDLKVGDSVVTGPYRTLRRLKDGQGVKPEKASTKKNAEKTQQAAT